MKDGGRKAMEREKRVAGVLAETRGGEQTPPLAVGKEGGERERAAGCPRNSTPLHRRIKRVKIAHKVHYRFPPPSPTDTREGR